MGLGIKRETVGDIIVGEDCTFIAVVIAGDDTGDGAVEKAFHSAVKSQHELVVKKFIDPVEDENGVLQNISFKDEDKFN